MILAFAPSAAARFAAFARERAGNAAERPYIRQDVEKASSRPHFLLDNAPKMCYNEDRPARVCRQLGWGTSLAGYLSESGSIGWDCRRYARTERPGAGGRAGGIVHTGVEPPVWSASVSFWKEAGPACGIN